MKKLNEHAAALFESGDDQEVNNGLIIMNELIVPCLPLLLVDEMEEKDIVAVEDMRNRWCSYLGQEMERKYLLAYMIFSIFLNVLVCILNGAWILCVLVTYFELPWLLNRMYTSKWTAVFSMYNNEGLQYFPYVTVPLKETFFFSKRKNIEGVSVPTSS